MFFSRTIFNISYISRILHDFIDNRSFGKLSQLYFKNEVLFINKKDNFAHKHTKRLIKKYYLNEMCYHKYSEYIILF